MLNELNTPDTGLTHLFHAGRQWHCRRFGHTWLHRWVIDTLSHCRQCGRRISAVRVRAWNRSQVSGATRQRSVDGYCVRTLQRNNASRWLSEWRAVERCSMRQCLADRSCVSLWLLERISAPAVAEAAALCVMRDCAYRHQLNAQDSSR